MDGFGDRQQAIQPVPQARIREKVDACMGRGDFAGAEKALLYWLGEARAGNDLRGELMVQNELVGHYRKTGDREKFLQSAGEALRLMKALEFEGTISAATAYVNIATAYSAFGENERALPLFERAESVYRQCPAADRALLGGLFNNMGLALAALGRYDEAFRRYESALEAMGGVPGGEPEMAVTCLNMADAVAARDGMEAGEAEIWRLLDRAELLLKTARAPRNGYFAYVLRNCAPVFDTYGYFLAAEACRREAAEISERA
ncbi:MAG: tetratricopeptide repeat protein [Clostridia bacterium]|nr:tetratricopeptide repeat protein [Clostridia bacterium]